jgi:hypothetical protein
MIHNTKISSKQKKEKHGSKTISPSLSNAMFCIGWYRVGIYRISLRTSLQFSADVDFVKKFAMRMSSTWKA